MLALGAGEERKGSPWGLVAGAAAILFIGWYTLSQESRARAAMYPAQMRSRRARPNRRRKRRR